LPKNPKDPPLDFQLLCIYAPSPVIVPGMGETMDKVRLG
jgi:hypothetical protein